MRASRGNGKGKGKRDERGEENANLPDKKLKSIIIGYLMFFIATRMWSCILSSTRTCTLHADSVIRKDDARSAANNIPMFLCPYRVYRVWLRNYYYHCYRRCNYDSNYGNSDNYSLIHSSMQCYVMTGSSVYALSLFHLSAHLINETMQKLHSSLFWKDIL